MVERDYAPAWLARYGRALRHTIEPEAHYQFVSGIDNFRNILRFDPTELASDTNEVEYSITQRFYFKRLHPQPCASSPLPPPSNGRVFLPVDFRDCTNTDTTESLTWTVGQKRYFDPKFGGAVFTNRRNVLATTLDLTGISFLAGPRDYSPLISRLALRANQTLDFGWDIDYDLQAGRINGSSVYADVRPRQRLRLGQPRAPRCAERRHSPQPHHQLRTDSRHPGLRSPAPNRASAAPSTPAMT